MTEPKSLVIDANIILRAMLEDVPEQAAKVRNLLGKAEVGELLLLIPEPVLSDVVYVLDGMKIPKEEIAQAVRGWLNLPGIAPLGIDIGVVHTSLDLFVEKNIKWSDALIAARMIEWGHTEICTFDRHFDRIPKINRVEPN
ncbi:PIN domain-containing protein [Anaeroselena agilis]|uniref:PIN domain-containing protein n=1 Tax=Anaeroselena agilis TaxID=3063788 RepID=A0ABU3NTG2_9FIRM|nr:PIN domain-containing protein [Selenomonadales bacterium 4137-cl]